MDLKVVKLGKNMDFRYVPFSELAVPWNVSVDPIKADRDRHSRQWSGVPIDVAMANKRSKPPAMLNRGELDALKHSIGQFGLLKPFEIAELPERLGFFYGKGRYVIIDGQRRYFAVRELFGLPTEHDETKDKENLRTDSGYGQIEKGEAQAQEQFDRLSIRDYVLIPCLIYPYTTILQMARHSVEGKKFNLKPSKGDLELAEKMGREGDQDLCPEDLTGLWETRNRIEEERQAIENTLEQIRNGIKQGSAMDQTGFGVNPYSNTLRTLDKSGKTTA